MKVRFAVAPGTSGTGPGELEAVLDSLEASGFDGIWLSDVTTASLIDPLVGLSLAAGRTERLHLGANVVPLGRNPFLLAKALAQIDRVSGGRLLLSFVTGLPSGRDRSVLGLGESSRGEVLEEMLSLIRSWWAGHPVTHRSRRWDFDGLSLAETPLQVPLEVWLGGRLPAALERAGRIADGWLGAALTPAESYRARRQIEEAAERASRVVDPEHFGMSIAYSRREPDPSLLSVVAARRRDLDPLELVAVGAGGLRSLIGRYLDAGLSKFVLRSLAPARWDEELAWLADSVLDMQT